MLSQSAITKTHQPVGISSGSNRYAGVRGPNNLAVRSQMSLTGSKMMGEKQRIVVSRKVLPGRTGNSNGLMIKAATGSQGQAENFFSKMGEKLNNAIDSFGNEASYMINPQSTQYLQLATGIGSIPAENPINQNVTKFQQIQNSLPQNINMLSQIKQGKYAKAGAITLRTRTVSRFTPIIFFDVPSNEEQNEDQMDDKIKVDAMDVWQMDSFLDDYWDNLSGQPHKSGKGDPQKPKVVILGTGQGGYKFGKLISKDNDVTLIAPSDHFFGTPSLRFEYDGPVEFICQEELVRSFEEDLDYRQGQCQRVDFKNKKIVVKNLSGSIDLDEYEIDYDYLIIASGTQVETIPLFKQLDYPKDQEGRILINDKLQVANCPGVYAIGENAVSEKNSVPFSADVADQQAHYLATYNFNQQKLELDGSPDFEYLHQESDPPTDTHEIRQ